MNSYISHLVVKILLDDSIVSHELDPKILLGPTLYRLLASHHDSGHQVKDIRVNHADGKTVIEIYLEPFPGPSKGPTARDDQKYSRSVLLNALVVRLLRAIAAASRSRSITPS